MRETKWLSSSSENRKESIGFIFPSSVMMLLAILYSMDYKNEIDKVCTRDEMSIFSCEMMPSRCKMNGKQETFARIF